MGILTNFLKLLKPEPNDFVDVAKHISENYDKLDENAKSNDETLTNLNNNKLDKGTYPGNASDLNTEISKIASTTQLGRMIVGKGMTADSTGKVSVVSKNDGITVNDNDIQLNTVDNLINTSITKPLSANQGVILDKQDKGVLGGYNGIFPLTVASKNGIYLLPATNKFYVCVENYSGSSLTAPNANFEELSVFQNRNKLENLFRNFYYYNEKIIDYDTSCFEFTKTSKFDLTVKLKINCTILINAGARVTKGNVTIKKNETIIGMSSSTPSDSRAQIATNIVCKINDVINIKFNSALDYQKEIMLGILAFS
ncbi:hypothetical protein DXA30_02600 [Fusobacterium ulcerans]|uniref:hypothetical protein n=1 Tax=Fusobacterium ulcerans TaxID=861 RepID=UPI000E4A3BB5|nr:hypothetical protein [Fusobacterium ulcerans]RGY66662.1 hypothetical protein DXA30_02600 [Fusobacterium ulcerans]